MSVRQSLLALLSEQPRHGYDLKVEFDRRTGNSWPLNIGQVYTTLDRLERDGLVVRSEEDADGRVVHSITPRGRAEVEAWFANPVAMNNPPRNELAIKIALAATIEGLDLTRLIQTQRTASINALQTYTRAKRDADPDDLAWQLIIESLIHAAEAEVRWLDHCEGAALRAAQRARRANRSTSSTTETTPLPTSPAKARS